MVNYRITVAWVDSFRACPLWKWTFVFLFRTTTSVGCQPFIKTTHESVGCYSAMKKICTLKKSMNHLFRFRLNIRCSVQGSEARLPGHRSPEPLHPPLHDVLGGAQAGAPHPLLPVRGRRPLPPLVWETSLLARGPPPSPHGVRRRRHPSTSAAIFKHFMSRQPRISSQLNKNCFSLFLTPAGHKKFENTPPSHKLSSPTHPGTLPPVCRRKIAPAYSVHPSAVPYFKLYTKVFFYSM